jgi:LmbE family N-acetylglucosaminyl deacetylase
MEWIYLSPHLDDVALSCGGLLWEQTQAGEKVSVWSICAGDPPAGAVSPFAESLHERWETPAAAWQHRRAEDLRSCLLLGASAVHFSIPDCIYRRAGAGGAPLYDSEESLWGEIHPLEAGLVKRLAGELAARLPGGAGSFHLVCPWTLGGHVDHRLTRAAAERLAQQGDVPWLWYYADYPYVLKEEALVARFAGEGLAAQIFPVSEAGLAAWQASVAAHATQISTFWPDLDAMRSAIRFFCESMDGVRLWRR